jgi:predicted DNA-binding transcriptional regulator YafY
MISGYKQDRLARLLRIEHLLCQVPTGLTTKELARRCEVSVRTTYRDIKVLEMELKVPIYRENDRFRIQQGYFLPPVHLTLSEAMALFLSARLASSYTDERDRHLESAFTKVAATLPAPIAAYVSETVDQMAERPENQTFAKVLAILTEAWAAGRQVRIWYPRGDELIERLLDPYYIEPSGFGHSCYVIGLCHRTSELRTFKIERIQGIELTAEHYFIPETWSIAEYLRSSWGIVREEEVAVSVAFSRAVAQRVRETRWHPSQQLETMADGRLLFRVKVAGVIEITPWILSWGADAEILEPASLRERVAEICKKMAACYE